MFVSHCTVCLCSLLQLRNQVQCVIRWWTEMTVLCFGPRSQQHVLSNLTELSVCVWETKKFCKTVFQVCSAWCDGCWSNDPRRIWMWCFFCSGEKNRLFFTCEMKRLDFFFMWKKQHFFMRAVKNISDRKETWTQFHTRNKNIIFSRKKVFFCTDGNKMKAFRKFILSSLFSHQNSSYKHRRGNNLDQT